MTGTGSFDSPRRFILHGRNAGKSNARYVESRYRLQTRVERLERELQELKDQVAGLGDGDEVRTRQEKALERLKGKPGFA